MTPKVAYQQHLWVCFCVLLFKFFGFVVLSRALLPLRCCDRPPLGGVPTHPWVNFTPPRVKFTPPTPREESLLWKPT